MRSHRNRKPWRPVSTFSIVARDPDTGQMGVAVESHWFSVDAIVPWVAAGVGAVATQSLVDITYGPLGLEFMRAGRTAEDALNTLLGGDDEAEVRQVAMVDIEGRVATHTGERCIAEAGHRVGDQYSVQANMMEKDTVWDAMAEAYESSGGEFADRMLAALDAAQAEGGDIRGRQSAAILIVRGQATGTPWTDRLLDIRVEDHSEPLRELRRLVKVHRAYAQMDAGDEHVAGDDLDAAIESYQRAAEILPGNPEFRFWAAITMLVADRKSEAMDQFRGIFAKHAQWREVLRRLPASGLVTQEMADEILDDAG